MSPSFSRRSSVARRPASSSSVLRPTLVGRSPSSSDAVVGVVGRSVAAASSRSRLRARRSSLEAASRSLVGGGLGDVGLGSVALLGHAVLPVVRVLSIS